MFIHFDIRNMDVLSKNKIIPKSVDFIKYQGTLYRRRLHDASCGQKSFQTEITYLT